MSLHRSLLSLAVALSLVSAACSATPQTLASTEDSTDDVSTVEVAAESVSEQAVAVDSSSDTDNVDGDSVTTVAPIVNEATTSSTTAPSTTTTEASRCVAPGEVSRWIDVAIDDPDGGLNVRSNAGVGFEIVDVLPRTSEVATTGGCVTVGSVNWWEVTTNNSVTGWASSRYLSETPVFNPGLGKSIADTENVGLTAATLDELARKIADAYGFDDDVVITMVGDPQGHDAVGGDVTFDLSGLKDDSVDGYRIDILFFFQKNADATEVIGFEAKGIDKQTICSRGVSDDGVCI